MLKKQFRFHGYGSLRYVSKNGAKVRNKYFIVKTTRNLRRPDSRVAVVISKKIHKSAVARNRVRRRVYEVVRLEMPDLPLAHDIVVIVVSPEVRFLPAGELHQSLKELFIQIGLYNSTKETDILKND